MPLVKLFQARQSLVESCFGLSRNVLGDEGLPHGTLLDWNDVDGVLRRGPGS